MGRRKEGNEKKARGGQRAVKREERDCTMPNQTYVRDLAVYTLDVCHLFKCRVYSYLLMPLVSPIVKSRFRYVSLTLITLVSTKMLYHLSGGLEFWCFHRCFCIRIFLGEEEKKETERRASPQWRLTVTTVTTVVVMWWRMLRAKEGEEKERKVLIPT